ncbi:MAG: hypothetical protein JWN48_4883 [Myxococcaceae bacterium]|nr:hypothetical protein [Myxococcaceae bacterium]
MVRPRLTVLTLLVFSLRLSAAEAQSAQPLRVEASLERMKVDGQLNEWKGAHFLELGSGEDASLRYALAEADSGLYVGLEVRDDKLVTGTQGDAVVLSFAQPETDSDRWLSSDVSLHPGAAGKAKAHGRLLSAGRARDEPAIRVVEGPLPGGRGYVIEAFVPWSSIPGAAIWEQGRAKLRFIDVDGAGEKTVLATAEGSGKALPPLLLGEGMRDLLGSFLRTSQLEEAVPRYDFRSNVSGDAAPERVVLVDRYVLVYGPGYKQGQGSSYFALPFSVGGGLKSASLLDLTGDGRSELVVVVHQQNQLGARDAWLVLSLSDEVMAQRFGVELRKEASGGFVEDSVSILPSAPGSNVKRIEVKLGRASGLDAARYHEQPASDLEPILLPWGDIESRRYAFDGQQFAKLDETRRRGASSAVGTPPTSPSQRAPTPAPEVVAASAPVDGDAVLALFRQQQGLPPDRRPTRTLQADILKGNAKERIDVFGSVLVFTGPDVALGKGYLSYAVPVSQTRDLLETRSADVTADGSEELLLRIRQPLGRSAASGARAENSAEGVERELLLVLHGDEHGQIVRALVVEVARRQGERAIENHVLTQAGALVIEPGSARGWTQLSYPFTSDAVAGVEPLLLPWKDRPTRYHREGAVLVPVR